MSFFLHYIPQCRQLSLSKLSLQAIPCLPFKNPVLVPKKESTDGIKFPSDWIKLLSDGINLLAKSEPSSGLHLYSSMSEDALKKLCTLRKLSVPKKTLKEERINIIIAHDNMNKLMTAESMSHLLKKPKSSTRVFQRISGSSGNNV